MISKKIQENLHHSSWIRAMFEEGNKLKAIYGDEQVFDFSIGNPEFEPPETVINSLRKYINGDFPGIHKYTSNAGMEDVRTALAKQLSKESGIRLNSGDIVMTCGAAGGLNIALKTILDPGDEVIVFAPFFVEYKSYVDNHGGVTVIVPTLPDTFLPDLDELKKNITAKTKALIINNPNNPTGVVYDQKLLTAMAELVTEKEGEYNTSIYVLSDEPYAKIVYDDVKVPSILSVFNNSMLINSYSKSLALPGERIGYVAVNPSAASHDLIVNGLVYSNRTLGFVNAPALFQLVIADSLEASIDINEYKKRRDLLYDILMEAGFECNKPQGAFYMFPKSLIPDDIAFINHAVKYKLLLVPGSGFGYPGYFRMSYCIDIKTIERSHDALIKLAKDFLQ